MTKNQQERLDYIYNILTECQLTLCSSNEIDEDKAAKKHLYIPLKKRINTLKTENQFNKLRSYI
tara:strand:+ start:24 stop:215 length:192 start_codon:yes stop_codon:yes gene_type:complete